MTDQKIIDIFWEVVGDPEQNEYEFEQYMSMVDTTLSEAEVRAIAKIVKEIADESPYDA